LGGGERGPSTPRLLRFAQRPLAQDDNLTRSNAEAVIITPMTFQQLLQGAEVLSQSGNPALPGGIRFAAGAAGTVFVAMKGETSDGNRFIDQAIAAGAVAVVTDSATETRVRRLPGRRLRMGGGRWRLSANFYRHPAERIANTGITGRTEKARLRFD